MSDGPHRSLPMRLGWRRVAERGDNRAFAPDEISKAIIPALEQDCRAEMNSEFLHDICAVFQEQDASLFKDDVKPKIEALRSKAGCGIGRTLLDNVIQISASDAAGIAALNQSHDRRFGHRAARCGRQCEEHYLRKPTGPRANNVRARFDQGIACTPFEALARQILKLDAGSLARRALKLQGLHDGVSLR
jgi:hypothetical protein